MKADVRKIESSSRSPNSAVISYELQKRLEESFAGLSGTWVSRDSPDELELDVDYRILKIKGNKWPELNGAVVLLGMPQADFIYAGNSYQLNYRWDDQAKRAVEVVIMRTKPLDSDNLEEIELQKKE